MDAMLAETLAGGVTPSGAHALNTWTDQPTGRNTAFPSPA